jgi:alpha,alpha-trehalose phosphorylase
MRDHDQQLSFRPQLPDTVAQIAFRIVFRGSRLKVTIESKRAVYELLDGDPLLISHYGKEFTLKERVAHKIPAPPKLEPPSQPPGREPLTD